MQRLGPEIGEGGIAVDGHQEIGFGQKRAQHVDDAVGPAEREPIGVGAPDPDPRGAPPPPAAAPIASALTIWVPERTPESNRTGVAPAAFTTAGSMSSAGMPPL